MSDYTHPNLTLHGRHVPEKWDGRGDYPYDTADPLTGMYELGVEIDGAFVPLVRVKAGKVFDAIELAKSQQTTEPSASG